MVGDIGGELMRQGGRMDRVKEQIVLIAWTQTPGRGAGEIAGPARGSYNTPRVVFILTGALSLAPTRRAVCPVSGPSSAGFFFPISNIRPTAFMDADRA